MKSLARVTGRCLDYFLGNHQKFCYLESTESQVASMVAKFALICDGKEYESVKALAEAFRVHPSTVGRRLRDGWTPEQAVGLTVHKRLGNPNFVTYEGKQYRDLKELALAYGVDPRNLRNRIRLGYNIEDSIKGRFKERKSGVAKSVVFQGRVYNSIAELSRAHGQTGQNVTRRLARGWGLEQALMLTEAPPRFRNFEGHARNVKWKQARVTKSGSIEPTPDHGGYKLYLIRNSVNQKEYVGITVGNLEQRLKQHFSAARRGRKAPLPNAIRAHGEDKFQIELIRSDAVTYEELQNQEIDEISRRNTIKNGYNVAIGGAIGASRAVFIAGRTFASLAQAAEHFGIDQFTFTQRISKLGWSPEEAAGLIPKEWKGKAKQIVIGDLVFSSLIDAAKHFGISYKRVHDRLVAKKWTLEQALEIDPPPGTAKFSGISVTVFGKKYGSIAAAAEALGISKEGFRQRIADGVSPELAFAAARKKAPKSY